MILIFKFSKILSEIARKFGNFLENDFWTPPGGKVGKVGHVAAAPDPLACPSRGARPPSLS